MKISDPSSAAAQLKHCTAVNGTRVKNLASFLLACCLARGSNRGSEIFEDFIFTDDLGQPDLAAARRFSEQMRASYIAEEDAGRIGIRQFYNRVRVRLVPMDETDADDAICHAPSMSAS